MKTVLIPPPIWINPFPPYFYRKNLDLSLCMIFQNPQPLLLTIRGRSSHYDWTKYDREDQWRRGFVEDLVLQHQSCKIQGRVAYWAPMLTPSQKISDSNPLMPSSRLWDTILLLGSWWPSVRPKKNIHWLIPKDWGSLLIRAQNWAWGRSQQNMDLKGKWPLTN